MSAPAFKLESRFPPELVQALRDAGHQVEVLDEAYSDTMGHAGALVRHPNGLDRSRVVDPRSDGVVAGVWMKRLRRPVQSMKSP